MPNTHLIRVGAVSTVAALAATSVVLVVTLAVYPGFPIGVAVEGVALIVLLFALGEFWTGLTCLRWRRATARVVGADSGPGGSENVMFEAVSRLRRPVTVGVEYVVEGRRYSQTLLDYAESGAWSGSGRYQVGAEVPVFYDPRAPQRSRLQLPTTHAGFAYLIFGALALGLAVASMFS